MPLLVKDFTWRQTENVVIIRVPLKGIHSSKVDIFTSINYIKAHYHPYLFEVFLFSTVNESESKCTLVDGEIVFHLQKETYELWERLEVNLSKAEEKEVRKKIIEKSQENAKDEREKKNVKKSELDRLAVRQQIALDSRQRKIIEDMKENEKNIAMREFEEWKIANKAKEDLLLPETRKQVTAPIKCLATKRSSCSNEIDEYVKPVPLPRQNGKIQVRFTARAFSTPTRESKVPEEEEWLKKQAEARRKIGFVTEDLSEEELDPVWLKNKGDSFFKAGNYLGAISAYSHAINNLRSKMPELYSNRAAAHIALGNWHKVIEDTSAALELLTPCVEMNALSRARCHARRGSALCHLGMTRQGMCELEAAVSLQPKDEKLRMDLEKARALVETSVDADDLE